MLAFPWVNDCDAMHKKRGLVVFELATNLNLITKPEQSTALALPEGQELLLCVKQSAERLLATSDAKQPEG